MTKALTATPDPLRGLVQVRGVGVPNGDVLITRQVRRLPEPIRGGDLVGLATGGFIVSDPEPPFGEDLIYRATVTVGARNIQTNRVLNPKAKNNLTSWTGGTGRTITRDTAPSPAVPRDATTAIQIGPNTAGATAGGIPERTLASTIPLDFGTGRWFVSGQVKYDSPDTWLWLDAKSTTWQGVRDKGTWAAVLGTTSAEASGPFASIWCAVLSPTDTVVVAPFQLLGVSVFGQQSWRTFQGWVDVPVGAPAGSRLVFLHGTATREYGTTFWLTTLMVTPESEMDDGALAPYFDGDTALPVNPAANLAPGYDWFDVSGDASIVWSGTDGNSSSVFTGPSVIAAEVTTRVDAPGKELLPRHRFPMHLSDPILPQVNIWFELIEIGDLSFAARQDLYDVISRGPRIAVSSQRAWADGEFRLATYTLQQAALAERLFAPGRILFMRNPDPDMPENTWYLAIGNVTQGRVHPQAAKKPERLWSVPFARVERPVGLIAAATGISWSDVKLGYTWDDLRRMREDWLDVAVTPA